MGQRENFSSGTVWEPVVGYSRAVRVGPHIWVSGTTATDNRGNLVGEGDPATQMMQALRNIERALTAAGAGLKDVVRTRIFVTNMDDWEVIGRVHGHVFGSVRPATTMVEVNRLITPGILVEVEAEAFLRGMESSGKGNPPSRKAPLPVPRKPKSLPPDPRRAGRKG